MAFFSLSNALTRRCWCKPICFDEYSNHPCSKGKNFLHPLIYTNPVITAIFISACLFWLVPELIGMPRQMAKVSRKPALIQDRGSMVILIGLQSAGLILNFALAWLFQAGSIPWRPIAVFSLGILFILLGVLLRWYAIHTLGQYFTLDVAVSSTHQVIQRGPYRLIRPPRPPATHSLPLH